MPHAALVCLVAARQAALTTLLQQVIRLSPIVELHSTAHHARGANLATVAQVAAKRHRLLLQLLERALAAF